VKKKDTNRDFLTLNEVIQIKEKKILVKRIELVRDVFVFACYTGLSYSGILKLNKSHFQKGDDNNYWIIIDRTKTDTRCRIPLLPEALEILKKYENHPLL
jgi:integrase